MPNIIIINMPMIYDCILHTQYISWYFVSAASIPLACCKAMFATKVLNFDYLHTV